MAGLCELCGADEAYNFHHFIPRTVHSNKWFKKRFTVDEMRSGLQLCKQCHETLHELIPDEKELGRHYHNLEKLLAHPSVARYVAWKRKHSLKG
ncbi:MAG: hypothetical protein ABFD16_09485 [Thermoguttaceae bacterium]|jgi:hypothetical protein